MIISAQYAENHLGKKKKMKTKKIDKGIQRLIKELNKAGLKTTASC